jgi:hypothetical protein
MRIAYEITPEDWAAVGEHYVRTSAEMKRIRHMWVLGGILCVLGAAALLWSRTGSPVWMLAGLPLAAVWAWYWPRRVIANVRSYMARQDRPCLRGRHMMEALPEGLHARCDITNSTVAWIGIHDIIQTPDHVFVILAGLQAYVIPRKLVVAGEVDRFVVEAQRFHAQSAL